MKWFKKLVCTILGICYVEHEWEHTNRDFWDKPGMARWYCKCCGKYKYTYIKRY